MNNNNETKFPFMLDRKTIFIAFIAKLILGIFSLIFFFILARNLTGIGDILSGGKFSETKKFLAQTQNEMDTMEDHFNAAKEQYERDAQMVSQAMPSTSNEAAAEADSATVTHVIDGDTIVVKREDGSTEKVRFIGINCPEDTKKKEAYGKEATKFTKRRLKEAKITMEYDQERTDQYGRTLAYIFLQKDGNREFFNETLVKEGYAKAMTIEPNTTYSMKFELWEQKAKCNHIGMWK